MAKLTDSISALTTADREVAEEWLTFTQQPFAQVEGRIKAYKKGETSTLKLLNDLDFARGMIVEASEKFRATVSL